MTDMQKLLSNPNVTVYMVGGYVRDRILDRPCNDHDFVVVGATPEDMLAAGFSQVGADFPVFLNEVGDEYALARTERKTGTGYHGFESDHNPSVTIEEDLYRRDLTMNAMAREVLGWNDKGHAKLSDLVIDPFHGRQAIEDKVIKHVSEHFAEDPVRVLRTARFAARFPDFEIHEDTLVLMHELVLAGELDNLVPERVWVETVKAMGEEDIVRYFLVLFGADALEIVMPELYNGSMLSPALSSPEFNLTLKLPQKFALLTVLLEDEGCASFYERLKAPTEVSSLAHKVNKLFPDLGGEDKDATWLVNTLTTLGAYQDDGDVLYDMGDVFNCMMNGDIMVDVFALTMAMDVTRDVSFAELTVKQQETLKGKDIGDAIKTLKIKTLSDSMS